MQTWAISPRDDGRPLRLLQLTDTHLFADPGGILYGVNTRNSLTAVIAAIKRAGERPDAILVTGDLSQDESTTSYQILRDMLAQLEAPVFVLPGNHDDPAALRARITGPPEGPSCVGEQVVFSVTLSTLVPGWVLTMLESVQGANDASNEILDSQQ